MASVGTILETLSCSTRWRDSDWNSAAIGDGNCGMIWCCCFVHTCWVLPGARLETAAGPLPAAQLAPTHRHVEEQERRPAPTLHSVKPCGPLPAIATTAPTGLELWCIFELAVVEERRGVARDRRVHTVLRVKQVDGLAGCGEPVVAARVVCQAQLVGTASLQWAPGVVGTRTVRRASGSTSGALQPCRRSSPPAAAGRRPAPPPGSSPPPARRGSEKISETVLRSQRCAVLRCAVATGGGELKLEPLEISMTTMAASPRAGQHAEL